MYENAEQKKGQGISSTVFWIYIYKERILVSKNLNFAVESFILDSVERITVVDNSWCFFSSQRIWKIVHDPNSGNQNQNEPHTFVKNIIKIG